METNKGFKKGLRLLGTALALLVAAAAAGIARAEMQIEAGVKPYQKVSGVSGNLSSIGSDTLNNLMTFWAEKFKSFYPNVNIQIEGKGSATAPPALTEGTSQLGPMSREMKQEEMDGFERKHGYKPTNVKVAVDALAVFVNKDNPIKCLSLTQVDGAFSKTRNRGGPEITTWGQLGLTGDWAKRPVSLYGRNSASGTYGFFKEHTLKKGDYKDTVKEQPGSAAVVQGGTVDRFSMGYSGIGYATPGVRAVPLTDKDGGTCEEATAANAYSGKYPLARFLFVYFNKASNKPLDPLTAQFLRLVLSREGQEVVVKDGYYPLPAAIIEEQLKRLD